jgi:serine/threonine protein kinase HipA of HipAB toxin-antitoxin module
MTLFEKFSFDIISALGINGNLAILIIFLCFGAAATIYKVGKMATRQDMHADHFNVLDKTHTESLRQSSKALEQAAYTKGMLDGILLDSPLKDTVKACGLLHEKND